MGKRPLNIPFQCRECLCSPVQGEFDGDAEKTTPCGRGVQIGRWEHLSPSCERSNVGHRAAAKGQRFVSTQASHAPTFAPNVPLLSARLIENTIVSQISHPHSAVALFPKTEVTARRHASPPSKAHQPLKRAFSLSQHARTAGDVAPSKRWWRLAVVVAMSTTMGVRCGCCKAATPNHAFFTPGERHLAGLWRTRTSGRIQLLRLTM